jgi:hypothetical protein
MRASVVVEANQIANNATGVLQGPESVTVSALVLEGSDNPLDHLPLFRATGRDELLLQPIDFHQGRVASAGKVQPVVRSQQEWCLNSAEVAVSRDQGLLQRRFSGLGSTAAARVPSQQLPGVAIDHQGQRGPVIAPAPDAACVGRPTTIRRRGDRRQRPDPGPESHRPFANLPVHDLERSHPSRPAAARGAAVRTVA